MTNLSPGSFDGRGTDPSASRTPDLAGTPRPRRGLLVGAGFLATALVSLGAIGLIAMRPSSGRSPSAAQPTAQPTAPPAAVQQIHLALHDMGNRCKPSADARSVSLIGTDVDVLIDFAARFPDARFSIDGEDGQSLNLLLIAADEMRVCAPAAAARAAQALPSQFRSDARVMPSATSAPAGG